MAEKSLNIDRNSSKKGIDVSKYYKHIVKTFLTSLYILFFGLLFFFLIIRMMPLSPYSLSEGNPIYDYEVSRLALDKNIIIQFFILLINLLLGFWGHSYQVSGGNIQISDTWALDERFNLPYHFSLEMIIGSILISLFFGIYFGYIISKNKNKKKGKIIRLLIILLWAIPTVGFGYIFQYIFSYLLRWFLGCSSYGSIWILEESHYITNFPLIDCLLSGLCFWDRISYLINPISTLNLLMIPIITYITYNLIDHFKSSKKIPNFTGKLGFFYSIFINAMFYFGTVACTYDLSFRFRNFKYLGDFNQLILSIYLFLITFFILNMIFNIIICGITLYLERKHVISEEISKPDEKPVNKGNNSVINEQFERKEQPKKNQRKQKIEIIIAVGIISLSIFILFMILIEYFIIFIGILGIIIFVPLIFKKWRLKLTSKHEIESNELNNGQKTSNEEKSVDNYNDFSKRLIISGCIFIIISVFGIAIYGWETSGKNIIKTQTTLIIGIFASLVSIIGVISGLLSAYYGKWVKKIIDGLVLIFISIPCIMILSIFIDIIGTADFNMIWIIGLTSIPIITHISAEIISNEMKKNNIYPMLENGKNPSNSFRNIIKNLIFPISGVLCLNIGLSIILFEGYPTTFLMDFFDPSFVYLGKDIRYMWLEFSDTTAFLLLLISVFLLFLIVAGFILLGLGLFDYKFKKTIISKKG